MRHLTLIFKPLRHVGMVCYSSLKSYDSMKTKLIINARISKQLGDIPRCFKTSDIWMFSLHTRIMHGIIST